MQLDVEMSFADASDVMAAVTVAIDAAVREVTGEGVGDIPTITWHDAMERFGTDKPDLRFGMELVDLGPVFAGTEFRAFQAEAVKGITVPGQGEASRSTVDGLVDRGPQRLHALGLAAPQGMGCKLPQQRRPLVHGSIAEPDCVNIGCSRAHHS